MERFAINILHKRIHKICRLCGVDQPHKIPIIDGAETIIVGDEDEEASLAKKIEECVGIQVFRDDKMPQNICSLCVDKINDFYEYRLMCAATNLQTRTILNLNLVEPTRKLLNFGELPKLEPSVKEEEKKDVKKVVEVATSSSSSITPSAAGKKGKKRRGPPSPSPSPAPTTRIKAAIDVKDEPVPAIPVKALTKKERLKQLQLQKEKEEKKQKEKDEKKQKDDKKDEKKQKDDKKNKEKDDKKKKEDDKKDKKEDKLKKEKVEEKSTEAEQKHTRSKRKEPSPAKEVADKVELSVPPPKKIKFEHPCSYCTDEFKTQTELDGHLAVKHVPLVRKFGCGSCRETFESVLESKDHNLWHQLTRTLYTCFKCKKKYDKNMALVKHMSLNACGRAARGRPPTLLPDIQCRLCNKKFKTQGLYEWHGCFLKPKANCPKCGKYFVKKQILTRHYMMFCTGTLPPPEPIIVPKAEPIDPAEKPPSATVANPERRTRRAAVVEPELPKEEREIPFPPPLELAPEAPAPAPSASSKKKAGRKVTFAEVPPKPATPTVEANKFASLLTSGAKLDRDTDIATINNLLSSVTEAIASISEAKAKKKKKKKDKNKEQAAPSAAEVVAEVAKDIPDETPPPAVATPSPAVETPPPVVDNRTEEEVQAYELAQEVGGMTLDQQLAFCAGKLPIVVLAKTTFKQECTEIDTEPSQLQEPMEQDDEAGADETVENGAEGDDTYDDAMVDYSGFQNEDDDDEPAPEDDEPAPEDEVPSLPAQVPAEPEQPETEELPFPMPIKQEIDPEEPPTTTEAPQQEEPAPPVEAPKELEKEPLFDERLAVNIKKEPGLDEDDTQVAPAAKRKRPESRTSAAASPASSLSSSQSAAQSSPKPTLILKIKKEKGLLNSTVEPAKQIRTIVVLSDDDEEEAERAAEVENRTKEPEPEKSKQKVYKKPNSLVVRIKQEKVDPAYERAEQTVANVTELPGGIRIKQERLDPDEESLQPEQEEQAEAPPPRKKSRPAHAEKSASPIIAFDGVQIKREKPDVIEPPVETPSVVAPAEDPKPQEKKKKSKVKINPFALLRQKMAAEAAAKIAAAESAPPPQAPSPLPVITNVVGNAPTPSTSTSSHSSSGENTPIVESETEPDRTVPVIAQVTSMAAEKTKENESQFPVPIKQEPMDEEQEEAEENHQPEGEKEEQQTEDQPVEDDFPLPIKEELPEETAVPDESPEEPEEAELPMPRKDELDEESHQEEENGSTESTEDDEANEEQEEENRAPEATEKVQVTEEQEGAKGSPKSADKEEITEEEENGVPESLEQEITEEQEEANGSAESSENVEAIEEQEDKTGSPETSEKEEITEEEEEENGAPESSEKEDITEEQEEANRSAEYSEKEEITEEEEEENGAPESSEKEETIDEQEEANGSPESSEKEETTEGHVMENEPASMESDKEEQNEAPDQNEEEMDYEEEDSPLKEVEHTPAEPEKESDVEMEEEEEVEAETADQVENAEQNDEQELENQHLPESLDDPERSTSSISDIPMDEYDQLSQDQEPVAMSNENVALGETSGSREPATCTESGDKNNETNETSVGAGPQSPDHHRSHIVGESLPSEPPAAEQATPVVEPSSIANPSTPLESDLEELQNLLTEGLKTLPVQDYDSSQLPPVSGEQNIMQNSSTASSVGNNPALSGLDDDLESLLNNKIEEISDQFRQPASAEQSSMVAAPQDELNLAIERELLHEMMPLGADNGLRTEMAPMPNSTGIDPSNNGLLDVERNLLLEGTGSNNQQPS